MRGSRYMFVAMLTAMSAAGYAQHQHEHIKSQTQSTAKFANRLSRYEKPAGPDAAHPYAEVPVELEAPVRALAMDDFVKAAGLLEQAREGSSSQVSVDMWLGLTYGIQAITYPDKGPELATGASKHLYAAISRDAKVMDAPDVARVLAELAGHGWTSADPQTSLTQAELNAERTRKPADFYYAGVISRRLGARAWAHSDTTEQDKKTLSLFAKALALDPSRYESWSAYLPALLPVGMHDLATAEASPMYDFFQNLRTPLLAEQGPAVLMMSHSDFRTTKQNEDLLVAVGKKWPDAPMPHFENAMRAIETSASLALELFPKLIADFENGTLKPLPREAGYYPSALYKYAFLLQTVERLDEAITIYEKVKAVSPNYAEVNLNLAILHAQKSDEETTGPKKLELLGKAREFARTQEPFNYRGRTEKKTQEILSRLEEAISAVQREIAEQ